MAASSKSSALNWFLHRITGVFLICMLITHFWVQHYDHQAASVTHEVVTEKGEMPDYPQEAKEGVEARFGPGTEATPYQVVMQRLADPVYAVLWKGFNILFLIVALHTAFTA